MNETIQLFINNIDDSMADQILIDQTIQAMNEKLEMKRAQDRSGWQSSKCSNDILKQMLLKHIEKGDMIDVINIAAMIMVREKIYGKD